MSSARACRSFLVCPETGDHASIQGAIDAVPDGEGGEFVIYIRKGVYQEHLHLPPSKGPIALVGEDRSLTLVTVGHNRPAAEESAALVVDCAHFRAENLTFENTAPLWQLETSPPAVAAKFLGGKSEILHCSFLGWQDTLWSAGGSQNLKDCYIEGHADWVMGEGVTEFENCEVHSKVDDASMRGLSSGEWSDGRTANFYSLLWGMAEAERSGGSTDGSPLSEKDASPGVNAPNEEVLAQGGGETGSPDCEMQSSPLASDALGARGSLLERMSSGFLTSSSSADAGFGRQLDASDSSFFTSSSAAAVGNGWDAGVAQPVVNRIRGGGFVLVRSRSGRLEAAPSRPTKVPRYERQSATVPAC